MVAQYPDNFFEQREIENVTGVEYDETKKTRIFAEDLLALAEEISAIQTALGLNVNGSFDTVLDWLTSLGEGGGGGTTFTTLEATGTVNDSNLDFDFTDEPLVIFVNGIGYRKDHGWTWSGSTATLTNPVGVGGDIYGFGSSSPVILSATGTVDDSNVDFDFTTLPTIIFVNGIGYRQNHGWTWSGSTATMNTPVGVGGEIYAI